MDFMAIVNQCEEDLSVAVECIRQQQGSLMLQDTSTRAEHDKADALVRLEICQRALACVHQKGLSPHLLNFVVR